MTLLYILVAIILFIIVIGFILPRKTKLQKSIPIKTQPKNVFKYLNNLKLFVHNWSPWTPNSEEATIEYNKVKSGVGSSVYWYGGEGNSEGGLEIIESEKDKEVKCKSIIRKSGNTEITWTISQINESTITLDWVLLIDHKYNPLGRILGLLTKKIFGPDVESALSRLKTICEKNN